MDHTILDVTLQNLALRPATPPRRDRLLPPPWFPRSLVPSFPCSLASCSLAPSILHPPVHGRVGQTVGFRVARPQGMGDLKAVQGPGKAPGFFPQGAQPGV